jgi:hypothetical protein
MNTPPAWRAARGPSTWAFGLALVFAMPACAEVPQPRADDPAVASAGASREPAGAAAATVQFAQASDTTAAGFYERLLARATAARWDTLAIGERIARFALALEGLPYLDGTLEGPGDEVCRVTGAGFDCVTFMETCLGLARITTATATNPAPGFSDLVEAVTFTRYRDGRIDGYTSRLHYTSEWILENEKRGALRDLTASLGGVSRSPGVGYMSAHPERYPALKDAPQLVEVLREIERRLNARAVTVLPKQAVAAIEARLETGDLIAIATSIAGLDYSHTGLIYRDGQGVARFLHASSAKRRVVLDVPLDEYLAGGPASQTGITVLRPREPERAAR